MVECEAILNSCPLRVDTISYVNSPAPVVPSNTLTMKSKVVLTHLDFLEGQKFSVNRGGEESST